MSPGNDERRPLAGAANSVTGGDESETSVVRCTCCGRELRAARSVELEIGPVCRVVA